MLARTKKRRINQSEKAKTQKADDWRKSFKDLLDKTTEGGLTLQGFRYSAELTQKQLAKLIGVKQSNISAMERGVRPIGKEIAKRLAEVFNTNYRLFL